jgi:hypothetical protein
MAEWKMKAELERIWKKRVMSYWRYYCTFCVEGLKENHKKNVVRIANVPDGIWTGYLPNTSQDCYCYANQFGHIVSLPWKPQIISTNVMFVLDMDTLISSCIHTSWYSVNERKIRCYCNEASVTTIKILTQLKESHASGVTVFKRWGIIRNHVQ